MSLSPTLTTISTRTPKPKHQQEQEHDEDLTADDDDDDISLAKCMTRKLQLNQQLYPWMSPSLVALQQQQQHDSPASHDSINSINRYPYMQYHQLQLQLQYQQQLMIQYQQQQQQQNLYKGPSLRPYHHHHHHRHQQQQQQQHHPGMKLQSIIRKSKSAQLDADNHDPKTRVSPTNFTHRLSCSSLNNPSSASATNTLKKDSRHQRSSLLSVQTDGMTKSRYSPHGYRQEQQKQRHEISSSTAPVAKHITARKLSIYPHAPATLSSPISASNLPDITTNGITQSPALSTSMSKTYSKPSLSKRIRGVIMGGGTNKQIHTASSSTSSSLRRSSSVASGSSSVFITKTAENIHGTSRSLWSNLFRKSSRSGPANYEVEKQFVHGKRSTGQKKDVVPDSPASSVSGSSYHRSFLHKENGFVDDLPSPASSTPPESSWSYPTDQHYPANHLDSPQRTESIDQLDYFGTSPPLSQQQQQTKTSAYTLLQHGSPGLQPSSNNQQNNSSLSLMSTSDDLPTCLLKTSIPSNSNKPQVIPLPPPISSASSSASTSTSSLEFDHQQSKKTKPVIKSISTMANTKIQFATTIQVHGTFGSQDYDRRCDTQVTCQRLTTILALQIKKELNEYKLNEMEVHLQSRQNTQFFLR